MLHMQWNWNKVWTQIPVRGRSCTDMGPAAGFCMPEFLSCLASLDWQFIVPRYAMDLECKL